MTECMSNRDELVNEAIARITGKMDNFRKAVKETTGARRDQKCRCRMEKAREVAALAKVVDSYFPVARDRPELAISSERNREDLLDRAAEIGQKLYRSSEKELLITVLLQNFHQLHQSVSDIHIAQQQIHHKKVLEDNSGVLDHQDN